MYLPLLEPNAGFYSLCLELDGVFSLGKKINKVAKLTKVPLVIPNYHQPNRGYVLKIGHFFPRTKTGHYIRYSVSLFR